MRKEINEVISRAKIKEALKIDSFKVSAGKIWVPIDSLRLDEVTETILVINSKSYLNKLGSKGKSLKNALTKDNCSMIKERHDLYTDGYYTSLQNIKNLVGNDMSYNIDWGTYLKNYISHYDEYNFVSTLANFFKLQPYLKEYIDRTDFEPINYCCEEHDGLIEDAIRDQQESYLFSIINKLSKIEIIYT